MSTSALTSALGAGGPHGPRHEERLQEQPPESTAVGVEPGRGTAGTPLVHVTGQYSGEEQRSRPSDPAAFPGECDQSRREPDLDHTGRDDDGLLIEAGEASRPVRHDHAEPARLHEVQNPYGAESGGQCPARDRSNHPFTLPAYCQTGRMTVFRIIVLFVLAAVAEIGGAWLIWQAVKEDRGWIFAVLGVMALGAYGFVAALQPDPDFGRVLAAYGGVFIAGSLAWGIIVDGFTPTVWDWVGSSIALVGAAIVILAPTATQTAVEPGA